MVIIDETYFNNNTLELPIATGSSGVASQITEQKVARLTNAINVYEAEYLKRMLGDKLYDAFVEGLQSDPIDERWVILKSMFVDEVNKVSPIANYVYANYLYNYELRVSHTANATLPKAENQMVVSNYRLMVLALDDMVRMNKEIAGRLVENRADYKEYLDYTFDGVTVALWSTLPLFYIGGTYSRYYPYMRSDGYRFSLFNSESYGI